MCGFLLWVTNTSKGVDKKIFTDALNNANHRGPDNTSILFSDFNYFPETRSNYDDFSNIGLGHNRLALVDLTNSSNQPYIDSKTGEAILFNGEYYNFRSDFPNLKSDTQAIFRLIQQEGVSGLKKVRGMFSLIFFNFHAEDKNIILARDPFGKKPLFFFKDNKNFIASSDFASIKNIVTSKIDLNYKELGKYISGKNVINFIGDQSIWNNIFTVKAGSFIEFSINDFSLCSRKYFLNKNHKLSDHIVSGKNKFKLSNLDKDIRSCVEERLMSDADVAVTISGGLDSSLIAIYANELRKDLKKRTGFYTCVLQPAGSPTEDLIFSRKLADKLDVDLVEVSPLTNDEDFDTEILISTVRKIIKSHRSPINLLTTTLPSYFISKAVSKDGYKALLDGLGGDEMMGGYPKSYLQLYYSNYLEGNYFASLNSLMNYLFYEILIRKNYINSFRNIIKFMISNYKNKRLINRLHIDLIAKKIINNLVSDNEKSKEIVNGFEQTYNFYNERTELLTYKSVQENDLFSYRMMTFYEMVDTSSMLNGVENRSPFLDQRLLKYLDMPDSFKHRFGLNKYALRKILNQKGFSFIANRKEKAGSSSPFPLKIFENYKIRSLINQSKILIDLIGKNNLSEFSSDPNFNARFLSLAILEEIENI